jgi:hypothetical protein
VASDGGRQTADGLKGLADAEDSGERPAGGEWAGAGLQRVQRVHALHRLERGGKKEQDYKTQRDARSKSQKPSRAGVASARILLGSAWVCLGLPGSA